MSAVDESSPYVRAQANLSELGLHEMCASLPDYVRMVAEGERDLVSALAEMTSAEVAARRARIMRQRIRSSGFPYVKMLADFDWSFQPSVPGPRSRSWRRCASWTGRRTSCWWAAPAWARRTSRSRSG